MTPWTLVIAFDWDWHIGSGLSTPHDTDRLVLKDGSGLPYIPGKSLKGILRDACEAVALGLDECEGGPWGQWVDYLFGAQPAIPGASATKLPGILLVPIAYMDADLRAAFQGRTELQRSITTERSGVKVDPETGTALEDHLRFVEFARGGCTLYAPLSLESELGGDALMAAQALLGAGAKFARGIGGKRRRTGAVRMELKAQWDKRIQAEAPAIPVDKRQLGPLQPAQGSAAPLRTIRFHITLDSPVLISDRVVGNNRTSLDFIPGSHLLPAVVRKLEAAGHAGWEHVLAGDLIVTNALPFKANRRWDTVPLRFFKEKDGDRIFNGEQDDFPAKQLRDRYAADGLGEISLPGWPSVGVRTHNVIEDATQRPTEAVGGVFSYEYIEPGQVFEFEVLAKGEIAAQVAKHALGDYRIGAAKKAEYGACHVESVEPPAIGSDPAMTNSLSIWFLSDAMLTSGQGCPVLGATALGEWLGARIGAKLTPRDEDCFFRQSRLDGWNSAWSLPRPSRVAISAGSVARFDVVGSTPQALAAANNHLAALALTGIGERTAEGFGRVRFNAALLDRADLKLEEKTADTQRGPKLPSTNPMAGYAKLIERSAWERAIMTEAESLEADLHQKLFTDSKPLKEQSQKNAFLQAVRQYNADAEKLKVWLDDTSRAERRAKTWEKWQKGCNELIEGDAVWKALKLDDADSALFIVEGSELELRRELRPFAIKAAVAAAVGYSRKEPGGSD